MQHRAGKSLAVLWMVFACTAAGAYLQSGLPLEQLCATSDVIVKVSVRAFRTLDPLPEYPRFAMDTTIVAVLKRDNQTVPEQLIFEAVGMGERDPRLRAIISDSNPSYILFLKRDASGQLQIANDVRAILPVYAAHAVGAATPASTERALLNEFCTVADRTTEPLVQARYLAYMAAFATPGDGEVFERHATSDNAWVRLASALAVARIDPQPSRMEAVVRVMGNPQAHLRGAEHELFAALFSDAAHVARCRAYGMDEAMSLRARAYLPIYRHVLDHSEDACVNAPITCPGIGMSLDALAAVGTEEDLLRLWRFRESTWAPSRHDALEGLARLLDQPAKRPMLHGYEPGGALPEAVVVWEAQMWAELEPRLRARGLLD